MTETTVAIIKPDVTAHSTARVVDLLADFVAADFEIAAIRMERLSQETVREFYAEHESKPFFNGLVEFMTSGPSVLMLLRAPDALARWRGIMGHTDPKEARRSTVRGDYGTVLPANAAHGSDSAEAAAREAGILGLAPWDEHMEGMSIAQLIANPRFGSGHWAQPCGDLEDWRRRALTVDLDTGALKIVPSPTWGTIGFQAFLPTPDELTARWRLVTSEEVLDQGR